MLKATLLFLTILVSFEKGISQSFQKEFIADESIRSPLFKQIHQYPDSSMLIYGYDSYSKSYIYTFKLDRCRNYKIAYEYDLKGYNSGFIETNQTSIFGNCLISLPSKGASSDFSPLLKFNKEGKLVMAKKIFFNDYLIESYRQSGICKINENKFALLLPNYVNTSDTSFDLIVVLDTNFKLIHSAKIFNKKYNTNFHFGIYFMNKKIIILNNQTSFSELDTNLSTIKSYTFPDNAVTINSANATQINDSMLYYAGATLYDLKNKQIIMSKVGTFIVDGSYEKNSNSNYILGGGYGINGGFGTIVNINPIDFSNHNVAGKRGANFLSRISDFEVLNNDILSITHGNNQKGSYPILSKSNLDTPFYCSSQPASINFSRQTPVNASSNNDFILTKKNIRVRMEDYMQDITESVIVFKLQTLCTNEEPFSGIGTNIGKDTIIVCDTNSYTIRTLNPNQSSQFYWSTGAQTKEITVNKSGLYKLRTVKGRCESIDSVRIIFGSVTKPKLPKDTLLCLGQSVLVDATLNQHPKTTYKWNDGSNKGKMVLKSQGYFNLLIANSYGCKGSIEINLYFRDSLRTIIMGDTLICKGAKAKLYVSINGGLVSKYTVNWYDEKTIWLGAGQQLKNTFDVSTKVKAIVTDSCTNYTITKFAVINVRPPLKIKYLTDTSICLGQSIDLFTDGSGGDSMAYSFIWNNNLGIGKNKIVSPSKNTFYRVILKDNCTSKSDTASCTISVPPVIANAKAIPEITDIEHPQIIFKNHSTPSILNTWDFGNGKILTTNNRNDIEVLYGDTGYYYISLSITSHQGCKDDTTIRVRIKDIFRFYIPNAFTPDGSGINDNFIVNTRGAKKFKLILYDRWGAKLFETDKPENGWDGKDYPLGVYIYIVELLDQDDVRHFEKGSFHLMR